METAATDPAGPQPSPLASELGAQGPGENRYAIPLSALLAGVCVPAAEQVEVHPDPEVLRADRATAPPWDVVDGD